MFTFSKPKKKQRDRRNQAGGRRYRKTCESILASGSSVCRAHGIETRKAQRTARQVNECDDPAGIWKLIENDSVNHECRREPERYDVGECVELAAKLVVVAAEPRKPSV